MKECIRCGKEFDPPRRGRPRNYCYECSKPRKSGIVELAPKPPVKREVEIILAPGVKPLPPDPPVFPDEPDKWGEEW